MRNYAAWVILFISSGWRADGIEFTTELDASDMSANLLTIQSDLSDPIPPIVLESNSLVIGDRIELLFPSGLQFAPIAAPAGWVYQGSSIISGGTSFLQVTYYYAGLDSLDDAEFFSLANPWTLSFRIEDLSSGTGSYSHSIVPMGVRLSASTFLQGSGIIPGIWFESAAAVVSDRAVSGEFEAALERVDETGPSIRFRQLTPGIRYVIESSIDFEVWHERLIIEPSASRSDLLVSLSDGRKRREFFRVTLVPFVNAP